MGRTGSKGLILVSSMADKKEVTTSDNPDGDLAPGKAVPAKKRGNAAKDDGQVAQALRSVYQRAIEEDVPSEMMDLLNKLG